MATISLGALRHPHLAWPRRGGEILRQVLLFAAGMIVYFGVRGLTEGSVAQAQANADRLISIEERLRIFVEPALQRSLAGDGPVVTLANWVYIWGHWPVVLGVLVWFVLHRPPSYYLLRNAFLISGLIGVTAFVLFPVAPPRLAGLDVVDTVTRYSHSYRVLQPPAFVNQYAAMPSLHFGWDLIVGVMLYREARHRSVRLLGVLMPVLMALAVVLTANHYLLDVLAGGAVALAGLGAATALRRRTQAA